jgi:uncharacterized membrane protein
MAGRLDRPSDAHRFSRRGSRPTDRFGKISERIAGFLGTPRFLLYLTVFVCAEQDRQRTERSLADTEYLACEVAALRNAICETAIRDFVRGEIRA